MSAAHTKCIACGWPLGEQINHRDSADGQVWITYRCVNCKTKFNVHLRADNRELLRLIKSGKKAVAIRLNVIAFGNSWKSAKEIINKIHYDWLTDEAIRRFDNATDG